MKGIIVKCFATCYSEEEIEVHRKIYEEVLKDYESNGNFIYVKFAVGQKAGSIAKLVSKEPPTFKTHRCSGYSRSGATNITISYNGVCKWDGRSNKPKESLSGSLWLKEYKGPTVWVNVSATDRKKEALEKPVYDIGEISLSVGDEVVYINARYGSGMKLCFGTIDRFEASYSAYDDTTSVFTIVKHRDTLQESRVANPTEFIHWLG